MIESTCFAQFFSVSAVFFRMEGITHTTKKTTPKKMGRAQKNDRHTT